MPCCSRMFAFKDRHFKSRYLRKPKYKGLIFFYPCPPAFLCLRESAQQCCFGVKWWLKPTKGRSSNDVREHWFFMYLLPCRDGFLMQREMKLNEIYTFPKGKGEKPSPWQSLSLRHSCKLEPLPKKEPSSLLWETPPKSYLCVCVKNASDQISFT